MIKYLPIFLFSTLLALQLFFLPAESCYIWGTDSGECTVDSLDPLWRATYMPFCADAVLYPACIPKYQTLPPTREFPGGRWYNHSVLHKDQWVQNNYISHVNERINLERNRTLKRMRMNEYGEKGRIPRRFWRRKDCQNAYKNLFCWINFPRCDPERDLTLPTCRSACENYFRVCKYEYGLWRCGKSKFFNGYDPEQPTVDGAGNITYLREYMTGQPFRENKYTPIGNEIAICTPAITGSANNKYNSHNYHISVFAMFCVLIVSVLMSIIG